jgi:hypothetical protein
MPAVVVVLVVEEFARPMEPQRLQPQEQTELSTLTPKVQHLVVDVTTTTTML